MKIENKNCNGLTFNAYLNLRGNVKDLTISQNDYIRKIISQIGTSRYDRIDMFAHFPKPGKNHSLIDIAGYIGKNLKATHTYYSLDDVYGAIIHGIKHLIEKVCNNEIIEQLNNPRNQGQYAELEEFIKLHRIPLAATNKDEELKLGKLTIGGAVDELSKENLERYSNIVNAVAINPYDELYMYIRKYENKEDNLINIAAYFNGILKSTLSNYKSGELEKGMENGISFVIEKLHGETIKKSALLNLNDQEIKELNELLQKEKINLQV